MCLFSDNEEKVFPLFFRDLREAFEITVFSLYATDGYVGYLKFYYKAK